MLLSIRLANGRALPTRHLDFVAVRSRRIVVITPGDSWSVIEPLLIESLDYDGKRGSQTGPGPGRAT